MNPHLPTLLVLGLVFSVTALAQDKSKTPPAKPGSEPKAVPAPPPGAEPKPDKPETPKLDPATVMKYASYSFGYRAGGMFMRQSGHRLQKGDLDSEQVAKGFLDAFRDGDPAISQDDQNAAMSALRDQVMKREEEIGAKNKEAGEKFLAENKKRKGVTTTESGLQYEILKKGDGPVYQEPAEGTPAAKKQFITIYRGTTIDGKEFDSSDGKPATMTLNVIPGFKEALTTMPVGSKWKLFISSELAYKDQRRNAILGPGSTLIFDIELTEIKDAPAPPPRPGRGISPPIRVPRDSSGKPARAVSPPVRVPPLPPQEDGGKADKSKEPKPAPAKEKKE